jgi:hypothetical protein
VRTAVAITSDEVIEYPIADSFRAPDTLRPAAAHLAAGMPLERLGGELDPVMLAGLTVAEPEVEPARSAAQSWTSTVSGTCSSPGSGARDGRPPMRRPCSRSKQCRGAGDARRGPTYADFEAGEYGVIFDPRG